MFGIKKGTGMCWSYEQYEYKGYRLDVSIWSLSDRKKEILDNAISFIENKYSLRQLSENCGRSTSTVCSDFHILPTISTELNDLVRAQIKSNRRR